MNSLHAPAAHDNPFATRWIRAGTLEYLFPAGDSLADLVCSLEVSPYGAIVGPHGTGKSTLLRALVDHYSRIGEIGVGILQLRDGRSPPFPRIVRAVRDATGGLLFVDGFEQFGPLAQRLLHRLCVWSGRGLIVTAHRATRLPTLYRTHASRDAARRLVATLCRQSRARLDRRTGRTGTLCRDEFSEMLSAPQFERCYQASDGNVRELFFALYDACERHRAATRIESTRDDRSGAFRHCDRV